MSGTHRRLFCLITILVLFATIFIGCGLNNSDKAKNNDSVQHSEIGAGKNYFILNIIDDTINYEYSIHTDEETIGQALLTLGVIEGEEGPYGLYVKTVANIVHDYNIDGQYWAFYIGDEYSTTGVDQTKILNGASYTLKAEK